MSHLSPWFTAAYVAAIVHRNHSFGLYQQNKSSESKVKFRQASNHCKRVLQAAKLAHADKTKESITSHNISVTPKMVKEVITNFDSSKVSGPDFILVLLLKNFEPEHSYILAELSNMCLKESCFPDCWRVTLVVPVFKNVGGKVYS